MNNIITICGSTQFKEEYREVERKLTLDGNVVLACPIFHHSESEELTGEQYEMLAELHRQRIDMSSAIYVINKNNYIGKHTRENIDYAISKGKSVQYMCEE